MGDSPNKEKTEKLTVQSISQGTGPSYHRTYAIDLPTVGFEDAIAAMATLQKDLNAFSPQWLASFEKTKGAEKAMKVDDEYMVHITGPWNGPVRVTEVSKDGFSFVTLDGHLEAGVIHFRVAPLHDGGEAVAGTRFEIESVTKSKDQIVNFFYDKIRLAMLAQTEMWELFCQSFARAATNDEELKAAVSVKTERQDPETGSWTDVSDEFGAHGTNSSTDDIDNSKIETPKSPS